VKYRLGSFCRIAVVVPGFFGNTRSAGRRPQHCQRWRHSARTICGLEPIRSNNTNSFVTLSTNGVSVTTREPNSSFRISSRVLLAAGSGTSRQAPISITTRGRPDPLRFTFATAIQGFGLTIDDAGAGNYTGTIQELNGVTSLVLFHGRRLTA